MKVKAGFKYTVCIQKVISWSLDGGRLGKHSRDLLWISLD